MSALQVINQIVEQEKIEKEEIKTLLSSVLNKLDSIEGRINFKETNEEKFLNIESVCSLVGFSHNWIYDQIKQNSFPKPIKFGSASRWSKSEVTIWMESQKPYRVN